MRLPKLVRASGGALLLVLFCGCAPSEAALSPQPRSGFVAPAATDDEALAAAVLADQNCNTNSAGIGC